MTLRRYVLLRRSKDAAQARRLLALAAIYEGAMRTEAAKIGDVTLQIVRDWVGSSTPMAPMASLIARLPANRQNSMTRTARR